MRIQFTQRGGPIGSSLIGVGGLFMVFGVLVLVYPELLALLFAGATIFFGILIAGWGVRLRRVERRGSSDDSTWPPTEY